MKAKVRFEKWLFSGFPETLLNRTAFWTQDIIHIKDVPESIGSF